MKVAFSPEGIDDLSHWVQVRDLRMLSKIMRLIRDIQRDPNSPGIGKPEYLKSEFGGCSSRRITSEHRLVYRIEGDELLIIQARGHY